MPNLEHIRPVAADASPSPQRAARRGTDPLLGCLLVVAQAHGQSVTADGVLAGLPLEGGRLSPALFERAAQRAGLSSRIVRQALDHIEPALLPAVLLLQGEQACVLLACDAANGTCEVVFPELGESTVALTVDELRARAMPASPSTRVPSTASTHARRRSRVRAPGTGSGA